MKTNTWVISRHAKGAARRLWISCYLRNAKRLQERLGSLPSALKLHHSLQVHEGSDDCVICLSYKCVSSKNTYVSTRHGSRMFT